MENDQEFIDRLQASLFREKLKDVEPGKIEEAAQRLARNAVVTETADEEGRQDKAGRDDQRHKTGRFRPTDR